MKLNPRNPLHRYNIPHKKVIPSKRYEPSIDDYDEIYYTERGDRLHKSTKARQKRKVNKYAKEERIFNE